MYTRLLDNIIEKGQDMQIKFFTMELQNVVELKVAYKNLIKKNHPDVGGNNEDMKQINAEYEYLFSNVHKLGQSTMTEEQKKKDFHDLNDNFREVISKFVFIDGLEIDIVGSWIWVFGDTFPHAQTFRDANFVFSKSKKRWYWYNGLDREAKKRHFAHCKTYQEVKNMHGCTRVDREEKKQLSKVS